MIGKLLKPRIHYLCLLNKFGLENIRSELYNFEGKNIFFVSYKYFYQYFYGNRVSEVTAVRNINLFCALGLMKKVPIEKLNKTIQKGTYKQMQKTTKIINSSRPDKKKVKSVNPVNFYTIYNFKDRLELAESRAKILLENKFRVKTCINKEYFFITLGQKVANEVYPDNRTICKKNVTIAKNLEKTLLKLIGLKGYTTKREVISKQKMQIKIKKKLNSIKT